MITTNMIEKGVSFNELPDICIIYVCNFDIFNKNRVKYEIKRVVDGFDIELDNGLREIYICANIRDGSSLSELMRVFTEDDSYSRNFPIVSDIKYRLKYSEEGEDMSEVLKQLYEEGREEGREEGMEQGVNETLLKVYINCRKKGMSIEESEDIVHFADRESLDKAEEEFQRMNSEN